MEGDPVTAVQGVNVVANIFNALLSKMSENGKLAGLKKRFKVWKSLFCSFSDIQYNYQTMEPTLSDLWVW